MGLVPHSGNRCSGLCRTPCDHTDCWQCVEVRDEAVASETLKETKMALNQAKGLLSNLAAQKPEDYQKATITHAALKALCERAGIRMDWNGGDPVFHDDGTIKQVEQAERNAAKRALEEKVKALEDLAAKQRAGQVESRVATTLAKAAAQQMDDMVNDIMRKSVTDTLKADAEANEARVVEELKAKGATDDDIEAAKALLGWHPGADVTEMPGFMQSAASWDEAGVISMADLKRMTDRMAVGVPPGSYIVHPSDPLVADYFRRLDSELQSVTGLNELLLGTAPAQVLSSGAAIRRLIEKFDQPIRYARFSGLTLDA